MRPKWIVFVLALSCLSIGWVHAGPKAVFKEITFDAGKVRQGERVEHQFVLKNAGDQVLRITEARPTCDCTITEYPPEVPPGGEGKITVRIKTENLPPGPISKSITIGTDDPGADRTVLQVKMVTYNPLEVIPRPLVYMYSEKGHSKEETLILRPHNPGMTITGVKSLNPNIEVKLSEAPALADESTNKMPMMPRKGDFYLVVKIKAEAPVGLIDSAVEVTTSDSSYPKEKITVRANIR